jgi:hypothetical protein
LQSARIPENEKFCESLAKIRRADAVLERPLMLADPICSTCIKLERRRPGLPGARRHLRGRHGRRCESEMVLVCQEGAACLCLTCLDREAAA